MPRFDRTGNVIAGYSAISYNKQPLYGPGGKGWSFSDDAVIANVQMPDGTWKVATLWLEGGPPIAEGPGVNFLAGGDEQWAGSNPGQGIVCGTINVAADYPNAGVLGASLDGVLGFVPNYAAGYGLILQARDGSRAVGPADAAVQDLQVIGAGQAIWYEGGGRVRVMGIPMPTFALTPEKVRRVVYNGEVWLLYWSPQTNTVVLHVDGQKAGYVLTRPGDLAYNRDMVATQEMPSRLLVCWSKTTGEAPGDVVVQQIDTAQPRVPLAPAVTPPVLVAPTRPIWFGFFEFQTSPQGPGSCALLVRNCTGPFSRPIIIDSESMNCTPNNRVLGQFVAGTSVADIQAQADQIGQSQRPILYWDGNAWPSVPVPPTGSYIMQRMYQPAGQSDADFRAQQEAELRRLGSAHPIVLAPQVFDTNAEMDPAPFPKTLQLAFDLADAYPAVIGVIGFSGFGRETPSAGGLDEHPDWLHACEVVAPQITTPTFAPWTPGSPTPPDPPKPPTPPTLTTEELLMDLKGTIYCTKIIPQPDYPGSFTYQLPFADNRVFSCNADGSIGTAPAGTKGQHETGQPTGNVVVFQPTENVFYPFAVLMVDKLWP